MSSTARALSTSVRCTEEDLDVKEARRLYSTMFGNLLNDDTQTPSVIIENLYLGSAPDARHLDKLQRHSIKYVLNMTGSTSYPSDFFITSGYSHVVVLLIDAHDQDNYDITAHFPAALNFIHKSLQARNGAVLVHCAAGERDSEREASDLLLSLNIGVSRSATVVAAYLMVTLQMSASEAILRVHQARPCVCPNMGFLQQLLRFERKGFRFE